MKELVAPPKLCTSVTAKLTSEDRERIDKVCAIMDGVTPSFFARYAIRKVLAQEEKKLNAA